MKSPRILSESEESSATETSDEFYMFEESDADESEGIKGLRDRVRGMCLQRARQDLFMPDLKHVPWLKLLAPGWPDGVPFSVDHPSPTLEQFIEIRKRLESGDIQFFWK
jgi:hypothetical protein